MALCAGAEESWEEAVRLFAAALSRRLGSALPSWDQPLADAEIAGRLFVAPSTIKTHLGHVFAKLGVSTRAELAALAARRA